MGHYAEGFNGVWDQVAGAHDVADTQTWSELYVHLAGEELRGLVEVIGAQAGVTDGPPAALVHLAAGIGDRLFEHWRELLARAAPGRPEIHEHRLAH